MKSPITNDVFDSRDLIEYKEYLEQEILDEYISWAEDHNEYAEAEPLDIPESFEDIEFIDEEAFTIGCNELIEEHENIKSFCEELENYGNFQHGEGIISEYHFQEYCEDFCKDVGYLSNDLPALIENNIDWAGIADDMKQGYTEGTYEGVTYYMRA